MNNDLKNTLWRQFGAAIDMLESAMHACPRELWGDRTRQPEFWYVTYHTLFWLDYYLSESAEGFTSPAPFGLEELDPAGVLPSRVYTKDELLSYLEYGRERCRKAILALTEKNAHQSCGSKRPELTNLEVLLYNMRHVQHGAAQLNLILRETVDTAGRWVGMTKRPLHDQ